MSGELEFVDRLMGKNPGSGPVRPSALDGYGRFSSISTGLPKIGVSTRTLPTGGLPIVHAQFPRC